MSDLIDRQAVLDRKYVVEVQNMWHMTEEIEVVNVNDIKALPSITPTERTGHWITLDYQKGKFECSECHTQGYVDTCMYKPIWEFCPRCGAHMGEQ